MSGSQALDGFLEKWRRRWPEWAVAGVFVPVALRPGAEAWFALLQEFDDILNINGDPLPADAKLGWWATELRDWAGQRSRHPLGRLLEPVRAPWEMLADALPDLVAARAPAADAAAAFAGLARFGTAVAAVEAEVLAGPAADSRQVVVQVLAQRLAEAGVAAVPGPEKHAGDAAAGERAQKTWAAGLLQAWPARASGPRARRIWAALARQRLQAHAQGRLPAPGQAPVRTLWRAWRAAAGGV
jgi:hypothetical protein